MLNIRAGLRIHCLKGPLQALREQRTNTHIPKSRALAGVGREGQGGYLQGLGLAALEPVLTAAVENGSWLSTEALPSDQLAVVTFVQ